MTTRKTVQPPRPVSPWIKLFVGLHALAIVVWSLPTPPIGYFRGSAQLGIRADSPSMFVSSTTSTISDGILLANQQFLKPSPLKYYLVTTGFWQYWDMFSPNPAKTDVWGDALIDYADGSSIVWQYPRMANLNIAEKYTHERYRKFFERAHSDQFRWLWPTFAQRVAAINNRDKANPVVRVRLRRHFLTLPQAGEPVPNEYGTAIYFDARISGKDLVDVNAPS